MRLDWRWSYSFNFNLSLLVLLLLCLKTRALTVSLTEAPSSLTSNSTASFRFTLDDGNGRDPCTNSSCSILCKLDQGAFQDCSRREASFSGLGNGIHEFEVRVTTSSGETSSARHSWSVDTVRPTAAVFAESSYTNQLNFTVRVLFSEPCNNSGGFSCNTSSCDLTVRVPEGLTVRYSTLRTLQPNLEYSLVISVSPTPKAQILLTLEDNICSDGAGNMFQRTGNSTFLVHIDRSAVFVNLWTQIVDSEVVINSQARTVQATNKTDDLRVFLDFTEPVVNSTEQLAVSFRSSEGLLDPSHRKSRGNRRFAFLLTNVSRDTVVTVSFDSNRIVSRAGTHVQPVDPVSFIFDQVRPQPALITTSQAKSKDRFLPILVQFREPVFQFDFSAFSVTGGTVSDFKEVSKSTYFAEVNMFPGNVLVSVSVLANKTADISGNANLASNLVQVRHYEVPSASLGLFASVTASFLATAAFSGALFVSTSNLAATGAITSGTFRNILTEPSQSFMGMTGHLQVFALSSWLAVTLPIDYREAVSGIRWVIPHLQTPWESESSSSPSNAFSLDASAPSIVKQKWQRKACHGSQLTTACQDTFPGFRGRKLGSNSSVYGPPLDSTEYQRYFKSRTEERALQKKDTGWSDFARNMFWLGIFAGALTAAHLVVLLFLRLRTGLSLKASLTLPRFELFLMILSLPSVSQACAFVIRGGTTSGIVVGVLLLALPAGVLLCVCQFLVAAVLSGAFVEFQHVALPDDQLSLRHKLLEVLVGERLMGRWVRKEAVASTFIPRYGLLFEDRKGPPKLHLVHAEQDVVRWVESGSNGIGRMRAVNSDDETEQTSRLQKSIGALRTLYILPDLARRTALGVFFGAYPPGKRSSGQLVTVLTLSLAQLVYLMLLKPYVRRGVQVAETVSLACEVGVFAAALALSGDSPLENQKGFGTLMLVFFALSCVAQFFSHWYAVVGLLQQLTRGRSFRAGLKMFCIGLVLPLLPRRYWGRYSTDRAQQPRTGLAPVVHSSPSPDFQRQVAATSPIVITETGVPYDAASPSLVDPRVQAAAEQRMSRGKEVEEVQRQPSQAWKEWLRTWSTLRTQSNQMTELRVLRELAKASFPRSKAEQGAGEPGVQTESSETTSSSGNVAGT